MTKTWRHSWTKLIVSARQDGILTSIALEPYVGRLDPPAMDLSTPLRVPVKRLLLGRSHIVDGDELFLYALGNVTLPRHRFTPDDGHVSRVIRREGLWWMRWSWLETLDELEQAQDCGG